MSTSRRSVLAISVFMISTLLISACTQSLSAAPVATPTLLPTGLFVSPIASVENPMAMIEEFAKQTAAAQTATAGTPGTPQAVITNTPDPNATSVPASPTVSSNVTPTNVGAVTATNALPAATSVPPGVRPTTYTLQKGEFPFCIARRFNVDPDQLLSLSGLTSAESNSLVSGTVLTIPQSGSFPGNRALTSHPATYTVASADETVYSVACKYGDVDPNAIATANNISVSTKLNVGQTLQIP
jgi:LysM repeat protein